MFVVNASLPRVLQTIRLASSYTFVEIATITNYILTITYTFLWCMIGTCQIL